MGGYGSGGHNRKRVTAEACVRIDVSMLRRAGLFDGQPFGYQWNYSSNQGAHTCDVQAFADGRLDAIGLHIVRGKHTYRQIVRLSHTTCNYGKSRAWLHCPLCSRRVFRLFYYPYTVDHQGNDVHYFACRHCRRLTYALRRERGFNYFQSQVMKYRDRLQGDKAQMWDELPRKPKGMHWSTYSHVMQKWKEARMRADESFVAQVSRMLGRSNIPTLRDFEL